MMHYFEPERHMSDFYFFYILILIFLDFEIRYF